MSERPKLPGYIIALNITMIVIVIAICILVVSLVYSPAILGEQTTAAPTVEAVVPETGEAASTTATTTTPATTTTSVSMTKATSDGTDPVESVPEDTTAEPDVPDEPVDVVNTSYDREFFANDLFIGDSITTGIHLYNKLDMRNVAASVGYTPYKAYTEECDLYDGTSATALDYAKKMQPERIYIMLGSNGLLSAGAMEDSYKTLIDKLEAACPSAEIYCISVTPVAKYTDYTITNDMVTSFNEFIKTACKDKGVTYIDFCSEMTDSEGYAKADMVADDGLHFNGSTYDLMLALIQDEIS